MKKVTMMLLVICGAMAQVKHAPSNAQCLADGRLWHRNWEYLVPLSYSSASLQVAVGKIERVREVGLASRGR